MKEMHIGLMPPPLGGISVYLYRLKKKLPDDYLFIDEMKLSFLSLLMLIYKNRSMLIIYHMPSINRRLAIGLFCYFFRIKYKFVLHGLGLELSYNKSNKVKRKLIKFVVNNAYNLQVVGEHLIAFLIDELKIDVKKITCKNAFIPPPLDDETKILKTYPNSLRDFRKKFENLILINAAFVSIEDNVDVYGIDLSLKLIKKLNENGYSAGLILAIARDRNRELKYVHDLIKTMGLSESTFVLSGQKEIWPLFRIINLMIRPTSKDGYGISIDEAIYFGCKVIASDVCKRNKEAIIFESRNLNDLYEKSIESMKKY